MTRQIQTSTLGTLDGQAIHSFTLANRHGVTARLSELGATLLALNLPDKDGEFADVVLGFDEIDPCLAPSSPYFGVTVGRVANRIMDGVCEVEGRQLDLVRNDGRHHLHGGWRGFDRRPWKGATASTPNGQTVMFQSTSPAGEEGYPGTLEARVRYTLTDGNELQIEMTARTSETSPVNLAHHSYWNLEGHGSGNVLQHELQLHASRYTPGDPVPDGRVMDVQGTPYDFRQAKALATDLERSAAEPVGFDHNWIVDGPKRSLRPVARLVAPISRRVMVLEADQPGVQFYSGNFLDGSALGKQGVIYRRHAGLCLETQCHPNSVNVPEWRADVMLAPGDLYRHRMIHRFGIAD